jgi:predicted RNA-binding Zn-ribbon protein involved in translation (DUF1610 family)
MHSPTRIDVDVTVGEQYVDFRCARCGHVAQAAVAGGGTGLRVNGLSVSNAALDARVGAEQAARLVPCPRCGHRDRAAVAKVVATGATIGLIAAFAAGLVAAEQLRGLVADPDVGIHTGVATFLAVVATTTSLKLRSVRRRVRLLRVVR